MRNKVTNRLTVDVNFTPVKQSKPSQAMSKRLYVAPWGLMSILRVLEEKAGPGTRSLSARKKHFGVSSDEVTP